MRLLHGALKLALKHVRVVVLERSFISVQVRVIIGGPANIAHNAVQLCDGLVAHRFSEF